MSEPSREFDPVDDLANAFLERYRRGERPSLSEYADKYPELAERIRTVFPALVVMEEIGRDGGQSTGLQAGPCGSPTPTPERLGDYLLLRRVGAGGMGIVYAAIQESLGRHVALKTLPFHHLSDPTRLERFRREARAAARLHHTHIVPVFGVGEHEGLHYYTMQFIRGHGLDAVLREVKRLRRDPNSPTATEAQDGNVSSIVLASCLRTGRFPADLAETGERGSLATGALPAIQSPASVPLATSLSSSDERTELSDQPEAQYLRSVARIGVQVAEALEYAHQQGILHRDIQHRLKVRAVAISPDGRTILTASDDKTAQLWDALTNEPLGRPLVHQGPVVSVALSADSKSFLTVSTDHTVKLWDADLGQPLGLILEREVLGRAAAFGPAGKSVITGYLDGTMRHWNATTGELIGPIMRHQDEVYVLAVSPDGETLLSGSKDKSARLWNLATGKPIGQPLLHDHSIHVVAFSSDGKTIMTGREDQTVRLWNASNGAPLGQPIRQSDSVRGGDLSRDGKSFVAGCGNGSVQLWDLATRTALGEPFRHPGCVSAASLSPDGKILLTGCEDGTARLWDTRTRVLRAAPLVHQAWVRCVDFSPDGATFPTALSWNVRGDFWLMRSRPERAAPDIAAAIRLDPDKLTLRYSQIVLLAFSGDHDRLQAAATDLLSQFARSTNFQNPNDVACYCVLAPDMVADREEPVPLAEAAVKAALANEMPQILNTLGAALYRAGRFEEAIRCLEEGIQGRGGVSLPQDWVFLALAHERLGHATEARRWLDRFQTQEVNEKPNGFLDEVEIHLLRNEAEAQILFDPIFPRDPFAH
jgi:WD40 repeat protein